MFGSFIYWIKSLAIIRFLWWIVKNLWPIFVFLLFWPEIWEFLSQFEICRAAAWRIDDVWWEIKGTMAYRHVTEFLSDAWDWIVAFLRPGISAIGSFVSGLFD